MDPQDIPDGSENKSGANSASAGQKSPDPFGGDFQFSKKKPPQIICEASPLEPIIELVENQQDVVSTPSTTAVTTIVEPVSPVRKEPREPIELDSCMKILADKSILENDSAFFCSKCNSK